MEGLTKIINSMPSLVIAFLLTSMILMVGGIVMYKSGEVGDDIITNATHVSNIVGRADSFNSIGDEVDTTNTTLATLIIIFALVAVVVAIILGFKNLKRSGDLM